MRLAPPTAIATCSFLVACTHIVNRPSECAPALPFAGKPALGWERVAGVQKVSGIVVAPSALVPLSGTFVSLTRLPIPQQGNSRGIQKITDNSGGFVFEPISPASYLIRVRRLGYMPVQDTIEVKRDSTLAVIAVLVRQNMMLDECSLTYQKVRVPWWRQS
jgi:hypothetical protein